MCDCSLLLCYDPLAEVLQLTLAALSMPLFNALLGCLQQAQETEQEQEPSQEAQPF